MKRCFISFSFPKNNQKKIERVAAPNLQPKQNCTKGLTRRLSKKIPRPDIYSKYGFKWLKVTWGLEKV